MAKKLKGKGWYTIVAPKIFGEKILGETPAGDPNTLLNRKIEVSLINLINDPSKYYLKFRFRVNKIDGNRLLTEFDGLECLRDYISRMIRHGVKRIDTVQDLVTKDKKKIRVKTLILTSRRAKKEIEVAIRKFVKDKLKKQIESMTLDEFIESVTNDSIKKSIMNEGSKIYPLNVFEMRKVERLS